MSSEWIDNGVNIWKNSWATTSTIDSDRLSYEEASDKTTTVEVWCSRAPNPTGDVSESSDK